jgi:hypothetical protein
MDCVSLELFRKKMFLIDPQRQNETKRRRNSMVKTHFDDKIIEISEVSLSKKLKKIKKCEFLVKLVELKGY